MTIDDYEGVYKLWRSTPGMGLNSHDDTRDGILKYLTRNPNTCFIAVKDDEIIGAILSGHDGRRGLIYHAAVKEGERSKGLGSALVQRAIQALSKEGIIRVYLTVYADNEPGNEFWERRGFIIPDDVNYRAKDI
jgi:ribosomal protein S18 acetylase RimI-like enzyme